MSTSDPASVSFSSVVWRTLAWWCGRAIGPGLWLLSCVLAIVALGVAQRAGWLASTVVTQGGASATEQVFTCPMHPNIRQNGAGSCPTCGMPLVPVNSASSSGDDLSIEITAAQRRLSNIQTATVEKKPMTETIRTVGAIAIDESRMATISSYVAGRLERLFADYTGVNVKKGDHLAVVYSPELYAAQVDYLESRKALSDSSQLAVIRDARVKLAASTRHKLVELGMQPAQLETLESTGQAQSRLTVFAPIGGTVIQKLAVEGKYIQVGEPIYRIADLSTVWLRLELYPEDAARIRFGQRVEAELTSLPGERFFGRVAFIDPTVDEKRRTVGVRVEFLNEDGQLRPGDYASATVYVPVGSRGKVYDADLAGKWISPMHPQIIRDQPGKCPICGMDLAPTSRFGYADQPVTPPSSLFVPRSAVLMAGKHSVVYVETKPGRFEIRPVTIGPILRDQVIIVNGLSAGENVATTGNFLIDSQMQLTGKPSLIDPTKALRPRKGPIKIEDTQFARVSGEGGAKLEELFEVYSRIQQALSADTQPSKEDAARLHRLASHLASSAGLPDAARDPLGEVARHSEHIPHLSLDDVRHKSFRPISHAVLRIANSVRGAEADTEFHQMYCPMVKGGAGDWLQVSAKLRNPYWGSKMLSCGRVVRTLPFPKTDSEQNEPHDQHEDHQPQAEVKP